MGIYKKYAKELGTDFEYPIKMTTEGEDEGKQDNWADWGNQNWEEQNTQWETKEPADGGDLAARRLLEAPSARPRRGREAAARKCVRKRESFQNTFRKVFCYSGRIII